MNQSLIKQTIVDRLTAAKIATFPGKTPGDAPAESVNVTSSDVALTGYDETGKLVLKVTEKPDSTKLFDKVLEVVRPGVGYTALSAVPGAITHSISIVADSSTSTITLDYVLTLLS